MPVVGRGCCGQGGAGEEEGLSEVHFEWDVMDILVSEGKVDVIEIIEDM